MSAILLRSPAFRNRITFAYPAGAQRSRSSHLRATYSEIDAGLRFAPGRKSTRCVRHAAGLTD